MGHQAPGGRPAPREAFGHPAVAPLSHQSSDDAPGHDDSSPPDEAYAASKAQDANLRGGAIPPRSDLDVPRTSLAERARQALGED